jgi:hypothetical protein
MNENGRPDPKPCVFCGQTGHSFYDTLQHIDDLLAEENIK